MLVCYVLIVCDLVGIIWVGFVCYCDLWIGGFLFAVLFVLFGWSFALFAFTLLLDVSFVFGCFVWGVYIFYCGLVGWFW